MKLSNKTTGFALIVGVAVLLRFLIVGFGHGKGDYQVAGVDVKSHDVFVNYMEGVGQIRSVEEFYLSVNKGGRLDKLYVKAGDPVTKNQIIAIVDQTTNKAQLKSALSSFQLAKREYNRVAKLFSVNAATNQDFDQAKSNLTVKKADLEKAKQRLEDSIVRSPIDGVASLIAFSEGEVVPDGSRLVIVEDRSKYKVSIRVPRTRELDLTEVNTYQVKIAHFDPYTSEVDQASYVEVQGEVKLLNLDSKYKNSDLEAEVFLTVLPEGFTAGNGVAVSIPVESFEKVLEISESALLSFNEKGTFVAVEDNDKDVKLLPIKVLRRLTGRVVVADNLDNQKVVKISNQEAAKMTLEKLSKQFDVAKKDG